MSKRDSEKLNLLDLWKKKTKRSLVEINLISDSDDEQGTNDDLSTHERSRHKTSGRTDTSFDENEESFEESREAVLKEEDSSHSSPQAGGLEATNEVFSDGNSQVSAHELYLNLQYLLAIRLFI